jgi:3-deoxy-D-manno-octulosonate 8-phosphate phosphatase (KDO 8-P phosphatase)
MNLFEKFHPIHTFLFDVDGVLTESDVLVMEDGSLLRRMNIRDGFALKKAIQAGYRVVIITGGRSAGVVKRLHGLGIRDVFAGVEDKLQVFRDYIAEHDLDTEGILYMGDDLPDYEVMRRVGLPCCPADAAPEIRELSQYISPINGGQGCVREVIEKVMRIQDQWLEL